MPNYKRFYFIFLIFCSFCSKLYQKKRLIRKEEGEKRRMKFIQKEPANAILRDILLIKTMD